jgi:hypothetical protein
MTDHDPVSTHLPATENLGELADAAILTSRIAI